MRKTTVKRILGFVVAAGCFWLAWVAWNDIGTAASMACGVFAGLGLVLVALSSGFLEWLID